MSRIDAKPLAIERSFKEKLRGKSRNRREEAARQAAPAAAPRALRNDALPSLEIDYLPLEDLRSPARMLRKVDTAHVREVAATMSALSFCVPVLIGKNNVIIDGVARVEAAKLIGLGRAPCVRMEHMSEEDLRLLRLAANRLGEKGQWNLDELKIEFEELIFADAPIEISGFGLDEIDHILLDDEFGRDGIGAARSIGRRGRGRPRRRHVPARGPSPDLRRRDRPVGLEALDGGGSRGPPRPDRRAL